MDYDIIMFMLLYTVFYRNVKDNTEVVLMNTFIMLRHALRWRLKVVQNINHDKKHIVVSPKNYFPTVHSELEYTSNEAESNINEDNKLLSDLRILPLLRIRQATDTHNYQGGQK